ncbi:TPA: KilA-N domain-containing protein [Providencia rettgeri]
MTNQLIISNTSIRKDSVGRYSLNDLHIASGSQQKHKPVHWLSNQQTNDLIEEIIKVENPTFEPVHIKKGRYGGTYVCKELVYSYAMWISAAFALKVIRAYDDLVSGRVEQAIRRSTVQERNPLKDAVNLLVSKKGIMYPEAYAFVHQRFNISSIEELTINQIPEAVEYIHKIVLEGEYIPKQDSLPAPSFNRQLSIKTLEGAMTHIRTVREYWNSGLQESLKQLGYPHTGSLTEHMIEPLFKIEWVIREIKGNDITKLPA